MANLELTFIHPTDNSSVEATAEASWTANFAIQELIRNGFLKELPNADKEEYRLVYKDTMTEFRGETTFAQAGVETGKVISVVIRPKAGANLELTFIHPTDNSSVEATAEASWTANFAIQELIRNGFLKELPNADKEEYRLVYKDTMTEFRGETTFSQAGVETGKVISVVIRPKAGYESWTGAGLICAHCRMGAYEPYRQETETDYKGNKTVTEIYKCNHCGNLWNFEVYREEVDD